MHNRLSNVIYELRKQYSFTQEELGQKLGVTNKTVSKWEIGEISPDVTSLVLLSELFNITLDELIKGFGDEDFEEDFYGSKRMKSKTKSKLATIAFILGCAIMIATNVIIIRYFFVVGMINIGITSLLLAARFIKCHLVKDKKIEKQEPNN